MKNLIIIFALLFTYSANANFVKQSDAEADAVTRAWPKKSRCEAAPGGPCVALDSKHFERKFGDQSVDDVTKPNFRAIDTGDIADCTDADDCLQSPKTCPLGEEIRFDEKANWPLVVGSGWFVWCSKILSYDQKIVKIWFDDAPKKAASDAVIAAKAAKVAAIAAARTRTKDLDLDDPAMTLPQLKAAVKDIREVLGMD